jgi:maleate isomerase
MSSPVRLGMLTPSSNTVLEPMTVAMLAGLPDVTAHFSRFRVTDQAIQQFDDTELLRAAELLAHARVDIIAWNGTSAAWLGFDRDEQLCDRIRSATGVAACTSILTYREIFQERGIVAGRLLAHHVMTTGREVVEALAAQERLHADAKAS